jgi:hypothetical protein
MQSNVERVEKRDATLEVGLIDIVNEAGRAIAWYGSIGVLTTWNVTYCRRREI